MALGWLTSQRRLTRDLGGRNDGTLCQGDELTFLCRDPVVCCRCKLDRITAESLGGEEHQNKLLTPLARAAGGPVDPAVVPISSELITTDLGWPRHVGPAAGIKSSGKKNGFVFDKAFRSNQVLAKWYRQKGAIVITWVNSSWPAVSSWNLKSMVLNWPSPSRIKDNSKLKLRDLATDDMQPVDAAGANYIKGYIYIYEYGEWNTHL
jgi:hypothetical protein